MTTGIKMEDELQELERYAERLKNQPVLNEHESVLLAIIKILLAMRKSMVKDSDKWGVNVNP